MPPAAQPLLLPCSPSSSLGSDLRDPCILCRHGRCARVSPITNSQRARLCPCALCTPSGRTGPGTHVADIYVCGREPEEFARCGALSQGGARRTDALVHARGPGARAAPSDPLGQPLREGDCPHPSSRGQQELASTLPTPGSPEICPLPS